MKRDNPSKNTRVPVVGILVFYLILRCGITNIKTPSTSGLAVARKTM